MDNKDDALHEKYLGGDQEKIKSDKPQPGKRLNLNVLLERLKEQKNNEMKFRLVGYFLMFIVIITITTFYITL